MPRRRRFLIAMMKHETNTFSPVVTDLQRFRAWGMHEDEAVVTAYRGTNHPTAAYIDLAEGMQADIVSPIAAEAMPSGYVQKEAYGYITGRILDAVRTKGPFDAILLDLHGAMVPDGMDEGGEGPLLSAIRKLAPRTPIGVTFDMHGNMTQEVMDNCDVALCYKVYPHTDMAAVGRTTAATIRAMIEEGAKPVISWGQAGILAQTLRMGTADEPMKTAQAMTRKIEKRKGVYAASVFGGFPMADIPNAGLSVVVVAENRKIADKARDELLAYCRAQKKEWVYNHEKLSQAVTRARGANTFPVILLDHADNVGSGGTSDSMMVIKEVLRQKLDGVAVATVYDPDAVKAMAAAGIGATLTLDLGGKSDMPSIGHRAEPLRLTGKVKRLSDGEWIVRGPMYTGSKVTSGPTAVFETGGEGARMQIVVTSLHHEPWDAGIFTHIGIDPHHCKYLLLKSRIHYRAGFEPIGKMTVTLDGIGVTTSDNRLLKFRKLTRPIYPLDK
jgi:microcystin degradation protein MlrC